MAHEYHYDNSLQFERPAYKSARSAVVHAYRIKERKRSACGEALGIPNYHKYSCKESRLRYKKISKAATREDSCISGEVKAKGSLFIMLRRKTFSFSSHRDSPPPALKINSEQASGGRRNRSSSVTVGPSSPEKKSLRRLKGFLSGSKEKSGSKPDLKTLISGPIPVDVKRYGVDNTDYVTGLPAQPEKVQLKPNPEEEIQYFYHSLPRPKKSTPEKVAIIAGRTASLTSAGAFNRQASVRSTASLQLNGTTRSLMQGHRNTLPTVEDEKHNSVSSEESGVSVGFDVEAPPQSPPLQKCKWFHGVVKPCLPERILKKEGDFLAREKIIGSTVYLVSVRWNGTVHHIPVKMMEMYQGVGKMAPKYSFDAGAFDTVPQLVNTHMKYKIPVNLETGALLITPITKGSDYEEMDDLECKEDPTADSVETQGSKESSPGVDGATARLSLLDRESRSHSVPTPGMNMHEDVARTSSASPVPRRKHLLQDEEEEGAYMEMSSAKSLLNCSMEDPSLRREASSSPEPPRARSSTPYTSPDLPSAKGPINSTYSALPPRRNVSSPLCSRQVSTKSRYDLSSTVTKSGKGLPNQAVVQKLVSKVLESTPEQLAFHVTLADAVSMKILPHPGEPEEEWWQRMREEGAMKGLLAGLEVLGSPQGEDLWKRLWLRHHVLSQWVGLCLTSMASLQTRTALLTKFIEVARALQGMGFTDIFGFMALMTGLNSVQVTDLRKTWRELEQANSALYECYTNQLCSIYRKLHEGTRVFALEYVTVPSIQQLGEIFLPKISSFSDIHHRRHGDVAALMDGLEHFSRGFTELKELLQNCPSFHWNARKKLSGVLIDLELYDYFMTDHPKELLLQMDLGRSIEDVNDRRRMFDHVLEILSNVAEPEGILATS